MSLLSDYLTENVNYTLVLSQLTATCDLHLQTGSKCTNHHSTPSSLPIHYSSNDQSEYRPSITTFAWIFKRPRRWLVLRMLKRQSLPTIFLMTPFTRTIKFHGSQKSKCFVVSFPFINATIKLSEIRSGTLNNSRQRLSLQLMFRLIIDYLQLQG